MLEFIRRNSLAANALAMLALSLAAAVPAAAETIDSAYTDYAARTCHHRAGRAVEDYGEWFCRGLGGMAVRVAAGDQRMTMSFGPHAKDEPAAAQTLAGFNDVYKARIEWRLAGSGACPGKVDTGFPIRTCANANKAGKPFAAIVRWSTSRLDESPQSLALPRPKMIKGEVLVVTRLGGDGVCHVGYVDALANQNAEALARKIADERARAFRCGTDKPVILGATGPGFSSSSEAEKVDP